MVWLICVVGLSRVKELVFSGCFFDVEEVLVLGLIDDMVVFDDVYDVVVVWVRCFFDGLLYVLVVVKVGISDVYELVLVEWIVVECWCYVEVFVVG